ncbi:PREDICTED: uncharacterized protein LOC108371327, partial [Rhagoletis zephyria]|uniref:uncharacterized protein LOC108371327 n=1 Tax=Rhagoletis zephyria TaxID=28612 RepID=UPI000811813B
SSNAPAATTATVASTARSEATTCAGNNIRHSSGCNNARKQHRAIDNNNRHSSGCNNARKQHRAIDNNNRHSSECNNARHSSVDNSATPTTTCATPDTTARNSAQPQRLQQQQATPKPAATR